MSFDNREQIAPTAANIFTGEGAGEVNGTLPVLLDADKGRIGFTPSSLFRALGKMGANGGDTVWLEVPDAATEEPDPMSGLIRLWNDNLIIAPSGLVMVGRQEKAPTYSQFGILHALAANAGAIMTREQLAASYNIKGRPSASLNTVEVHVSDIKSKVLGEPWKNGLKTHRRRGYRLDPDFSPDS